MKKAKKTIPVFDLCALHSTVGNTQVYRNIVAGPFGDYLKDRDFLLKAHRHSFYHIVLFTKGSGTQTIDLQRFEMHTGQIYFMIPGQVHQWDLSDDVDGFVVNFSEELFASFTTNPLYVAQFPFLRGVTADSVIDLKGEVLEEAIHIFRQIINEVNKKDAFSIDQVCFHLMSLFISITRTTLSSIKRQAPDQKQMTIYNFRKLVDKYYTQKKLPKEYAAMLFVTPNHLNALCNELLGLSAGHIIRERILLEAKRSLVNADVSISEIAFELNFTDNSYFTKFFKKYTGETPEEFRMHP